MCRSHDALRGIGDRVRDNKIFNWIAIQKIAGVWKRQKHLPAGKRAENVLLVGSVRSDEKCPRTGAAMTS
jgi:hypothetical protein